MARRQVTKTAIPSDSSSTAPELSTETDTPSTASKVDLAENKAQVELNPALLKVKQHGNQVVMEVAASASKISDQQPITVGAKEEQRIPATKDSCLVETLGKAEMCEFVYS